MIKIPKPMAAEALAAVIAALIALAPPALAEGEPASLDRLEETAIERLAVLVEAEQREAPEVGAAEGAFMRSLETLVGATLGSGGALGSLERRLEYRAL